MMSNKRNTDQVYVIAAGLFGNWLGAKSRQLLTGEKTAGILIRHVDERQVKYTSLPVWTNFLPALLLSRVARPRWLFAFMGGFGASLIMGDRIYRRLLERIGDVIEVRTRRSTSQIETPE